MARFILSASWISDSHTSRARLVLGIEMPYMNTVQSNIHWPSESASNTLPRSIRGSSSGSQLRMLQPVDIAARAASSGVATARALDNGRLVVVGDLRFRVRGSSSQFTTS